MPIRTTCPAGHSILAPDHRAGGTLRCPQCGVEVAVPVNEPAAPSNPEPVTAEVAAPVAPPLPGEPVAPPQILLPEPPPRAVPVRKEPVQPTAQQYAQARVLSACLATLAIFSTIPAVWEWIAGWQSVEPPPTPPWVFAILLAGLLQLAYAVYLSQLPDWSALWATTLATMISAAGWALLLGATLLGKQESTLVLLFRYGDKLPGQRAGMWCLVMLCFTSVLAYFLGIAAVRSRRSYVVLRELAKPADARLV
jgi:hypothetical protein